MRGHPKMTENLDKEKGKREGYSEVMLFHEKKKVMPTLHASPGLTLTSQTKRKPTHGRLGSINLPDPWDNKSRNA